MRALEGVRLIDFGQYLAGPFGPMIIGDLGADVIKVEPVTGDGMRMAGKPFFGCQRGKRDLALNVKTPEGMEIARRLIERADIVHHNMTKGVATRLGIDYDACKAIKPDIVYCNTYAYGREGPLSHFGGLDPLYQAATGLEYEAGATQEGNQPLYYRFGMCDAANAMLSVVGVLTALYHHRVTGEGQEVWTSLLDGGAVFASDALLVDGAPVPRPRLDVDLYGLDACYRLYETQDGWLQIAAVREPEWIGLCAALGVPELAGDTRFATRAVRAEHRKHLEALLAPRFLAKTAISWSLALDDAGVPNEIPLDSHQGDLALFDADNVALGLTAEYEHPTMGLVRQFGELINFSETPGVVHGPPPLVGQDTREILEWLGYNDAQLDDLKARDIVYWPDEQYAARFGRW
ncbi:MAG TPA: CoA transferase [Acidimicrobiia bacterium]|nr:CoA transferase [Acidimicrobiia bacterium]